MLDVPARLAAPGRGDDERNVRAHYDLSNEFFELMLDETMTYSCAVFEHPAASLQRGPAGQDRPALREARAATRRPPGRDRLGMGRVRRLHAAAATAARVTTTTISEAQRGYVDKRVAEAGLADRVTVLGDDWRDFAAGSTSSSRSR